MSHDQLRKQIIEECKNSKPVTLDTVLAVAQRVLANRPRELKDFSAWLNKNGAVFVGAINV